MAKDNSVVMGTLGGMMVLGGSLWTIAQAILQKPYYLGFIGAGAYCYWDYTVRFCFAR